MSLRVLLLTGPRPYQRWVATRLASELDVVQVFVEDRSLRQPKNAKPVSLKDRLRSASPGLFRQLARIKGLLTRPRSERRALELLERLEREADAEFERAVGPTPDWPEVPLRHVPWMNGKKVVREATELAPDVTIVFGTSILKTPMIRTSKLATLNAHTSLLPDFRGTQSEFWQVHQSRLDCAGVTVHYIDEGVDTGEILLQRPTVIEGKPDPFRLRLHNVQMVPDLFVEAVRLLAAGEAPRLQQTPSDLPTYRTRDYTFEREVECLRAMGYDLS
ncbi:MAG: formyltransferase family protein [Acidobacteriota bacterium]